ELGDVDEAVLGAEEIDEGPKLDGLDDRAVVNRPDFRLRGDRLDPVYCGLDLGAVAGGDLYGAIVLDVDLGASLFDNLADHLAARADDLADLVGRDLHRLDARGELAELGARAGDRLAH